MSQRQGRYTADDLLVKPGRWPDDADRRLRITPELAGWDYITFEVRRLKAGSSWTSTTGEREFAWVNLTGVYDISSDRGHWRGVGGRSSVFAGAAHALYLPRRTTFTVTAQVEGEYAMAWAPTDQGHEPFLVPPEAVARSVRGGDNVSRQINDLLPPGSPVHRLVLVEVYTPSGNWSSCPPHKHDRHIHGPDGSLLEADLEEVYYYKMDRPEGYAYQRVYTDEASPLHEAGYPIDALMRVETDWAVLVPEGYHPVVSAPGTTTYYLNVLAGSAQSLANQDDPRYAWVKHSYQRSDPRVPLY